MVSSVQLRSGVCSVCLSLSVCCIQWVPYKADQWWCFLPAFVRWAKDFSLEHHDSPCLGQSFLGLQGLVHNFPRGIISSPPHRHGSNSSGAPVVWWAHWSSDIVGAESTDLIAHQTVKNVGVGLEGSSFMTVSKKTSFHLFLCLWLVFGGNGMKNTSGNSITRYGVVHTN